MTSLRKFRSGMLSKLSPYSKEFIPQSNQRQLEYDSYPKPLLFNPNAEEFIPQLNFNSLAKQPVMLNPSAEEFIPQLMSQSLSNNADNSQDSHLTESQKLNQLVQIFIPQPTNMTTCVLNTEAKNYNLEEIPDAINADKTPISHELPPFSRMCHNGIAQVAEDTEREVCCLVDEGELPQAAYERAFIPRTNASHGSTLWLEYLSSLLGRHIHHALCGHGGERWIAGAPVDGYEPCTRTVYQYHGCYWHGCPTHCQRADARTLFEKTHLREQKIRDAGYELVVVWECQRPLLHGAARVMPKSKIERYPHKLVFCFEAHLDNTGDLAHEKTHMPIAVSVGDSLNPQSTHICDRDPAALMPAFMAELQRRADLLRAEVEGNYLPQDLELLPQSQQQKIRDWCRMVPVLGFNSGSYDLYGHTTFYIDCGGDICKECSASLLTLLSPAVNSMVKSSMSDEDTLLSNISVMSYRT